MSFEALNTLLDHLFHRGVVDPPAMKYARDMYVQGKADHVTAANEARANTLGRKAVVADRAGQAHEQWLNHAYDFISKREGVEPYAYDDKTGKPVPPGQKPKGKVTVGVGFNLDQEGARKTIEDLGLNYDRVRSGKDPLSNGQIRQLAWATIRQHANEARDRIGPNTWGHMNDDQRISATSLHFNLPELLGYDLVAALRNGDWKAAEAEVRHRSNLKKDPALQARRELEANLMKPWPTPPRPKPQRP